MTEKVLDLEDVNKYCACEGVHFASASLGQIKNKFGATGRRVMKKFGTT